MADDMTKRTIATYDKIALQYAQNREEAGPNKRLDKLIPLLKSGAKIADLGCAAGRDVRHLKKLGFNPVGVDLSEKLLEIARLKSPGIKFILADIRNLPFPNEYFDGAVALAVIHHLTKENMVVALKEINRILKKEGLLLLSTKIGKGTGKVAEKISSNEEREFTYLQPEELDQMLKQTGFEKINMEVKESFSRKGLFWITAFTGRHNCFISQTVP